MINFVIILAAVCLAGCVILGGLLYDQAQTSVQEAFLQAVGKRDMQALCWIGVLGVISLLITAAWRCDGRIEINPPASQPAEATISTTTSQ